MYVCGRLVVRLDGVRLEDRLPGRQGHVLYAAGHLDRVRAIEQGLPDGLAVAGAALHGVGVPACIGTARAAADRIAEAAAVRIGG